MTIRRAALALTLLAGAPATAQDVPYGTSQPSGYAQSGYDTDGQSVDSIEVFFEPLSHYGRWLDSRFGRVWQPNVSPGWRPYTIGHWEAGPYGQTWRSDEPFGWAVFHFGRWAFDPQLGWVWLPDTVWGPGWVAWRDGDDVTGWTPLPPQVDVTLFAYNGWGYDQWYQPGWVYVPRGYLYARSLHGLYLPPSRGRDAWEHTRGIGHFDRIDGAVIDRSFDRRRDPVRDGHPAWRGGPAGTPPTPYAAGRPSPFGSPGTMPYGGAPRDGWPGRSVPRGGGYGGRDPAAPPPRTFDRNVTTVPPVRVPGTLSQVRPVPLATPRPAPPPRPAPAPRHDERPH